MATQPSVAFLVQDLHLVQVILTVYCSDCVARWSSVVRQVLTKSNEQCTVYPAMARSFQSGNNDFKLRKNICFERMMSQSSLYVISMTLVLYGMSAVTRNLDLSLSAMTNPMLLLLLLLLLMGLLQLLLLLLLVQLRLLLRQLVSVYVLIVSRLRSSFQDQGCRLPCSMHLLVVVHSTGTKTMQNCIGANQICIVSHVLLTLIRTLTECFIFLVSDMG